MKSCKRGFLHPGAEPFGAYAAVAIATLVSPAKDWSQKVRHLLAAGATSASPQQLASVLGEPEGTSVSRSAARCPRAAHRRSLPPPPLRAGMPPSTSSDTRPALVAGASGYLGSFLTKELLRRGTPVRALVRHADNQAAAALAAAGAAVVAVDVTQPGALVG